MGMDTEITHHKKDDMTILTDSRGHILSGFKGTTHLLPEEFDDKLRKFAHAVVFEEHYRKGLKR